MQKQRRKIIIGLAALAGPLSGCARLESPAQKEQKMYGLIAKMTAVEGQRDMLSKALLKGLQNMPGNLSYIVANDPTDKNILWITEAWIDKDAHAKSLNLPSVQNAIQTARPLIAGMERITETIPVGGKGL